MERVDHRVTGADERAIKNQRKELDYQQYAIRKQLVDERAYDSRGPMTETAEEGDEDDEDEQEECREFANSRLADARVGLCSVCHITVIGKGATPDDERAFSCPQGHLLCHRCMQHFAFQSDAECLLCGERSQRLGRANRTNARCSREYERQQQLNEKSVHVNAMEEGQSKQRYHRNHGAPPRANNGPSAAYDLGASANAQCELSDTQQGDNRERYSFKDASRQHQQRSYCSIIRKEDRDHRYSSEMKINGQANFEYSRRPIRCPKVDCAVNVAFSALTHHFLFDHPEVPILSVEPGAKSTLIVSFTALSCDSSRCLALLLVSGKLSDAAARLFNGTQMNPKYRNRLPLPLLAARLHSANRYAFADEVHAGGEGHCEGDVIIVWVAGLDIGNATDPLRCSIQAVDNVDSESFRALTYTGPINSLRTAQCPREVFLTGDCIVLHEGLISRITSGCTSLNINVIVH